ncbi:MAG TPA: hypothetical protein VGP93_15985, partial [Polyangiaceae bacterium]|nr:hypothetical protein [Polyangiaceae bacterium]
SNGSTMMAAPTVPFTAGFVDVPCGVMSSHIPAAGSLSQGSTGILPASGVTAAPPPPLEPPPSEDCPPDPPLEEMWPAPPPDETPPEPPLDETPPEPPLDETPPELPLDETPPEPPFEDSVPPEELPEEESPPEDVSLADGSSEQPERKAAERTKKAEKITLRMPFNPSWGIAARLYV